MAVFGRTDVLKGMFKKTDAMVLVAKAIADALDTKSKLYKDMEAQHKEGLKSGKEASFTFPICEGARGIVDTVKTRTVKDAMHESHRINVDVFIAPFCDDLVLVSDLKDAVIKGEFNSATDVGIYETPKSFSAVALKAGHLCILTPEDVHAALIDANSMGLGMLGLHQEAMTTKLILKISTGLVKLKC